MNTKKKLNDFITEAMSAHNQGYQYGEISLDIKNHRQCCIDAINNGFATHYNGTRLDCSFIQSIIQEFGYQTVCWIFAYSIQERVNDRRISQDNKDWAYSQCVFIERQSPVSLQTHSGLIDIMCSYIRELDNVEIKEFGNDLASLATKYDPHCISAFADIRKFNQVYCLDDLLLLRRYAPFYDYLTNFIWDCTFLLQPLNNSYKEQVQAAVNEASLLLERLKALPQKFGCVLKVCSDFDMYYDYIQIYNMSVKHVKDIFTDFLKQNQEEDDITPEDIKNLLDQANCKFVYVGSSEMSFTKDYPADLEFCFDTIDIVDLRDHQEQ